MFKPRQSICQNSLRSVKLEASRGRDSRTRGDPGAVRRLCRPPCSVAAVPSLVLPARGRPRPPKQRGRGRPRAMRPSGRPDPRRRPHDRRVRHDYDVRRFCGMGDDDAETETGERNGGRHHGGNNEFLRVHRDALHYHSQACSTALAAVGPIEKGANHVPAIAVAPKALRPELSGIR